MVTAPRASPVTVSRAGLACSAMFLSVRLAALTTMGCAWLRGSVSVSQDTRVRTVTSVLLLLAVFMVTARSQESARVMRDGRGSCATLLSVIKTVILNMEPALSLDNVSASLDIRYLQGVLKNTPKI